MTAVLATLGAQTYNSYSDYGAGTDYVSRYDPYDDYVSPLTGAIGDSYSRPIMFRYLQIYNTSTSTGSLDLQIATSATGSGGVQSNKIAGSDVDPDWANYDTASWSSSTVWWNPLQYATFAKDSTNATQVFYYGLYKNDASRVYYNTGASTDTAANPNNVWLNGTVETAYNGRVLAGRIGWYHVPNAPTGITATSKTPTSITLSWTAPTDDGGMAINGYRILYSSNGGSSWSVFGSNTQGSPSGTTGNTVTVTGLTPGTSYLFKVAALNGVTDRHNGGRPYNEYTTATGVLNPPTQGNYLSTADHTGTNGDSPAIVTEQAYPKVYNGNSMSRSTMKVYNGTNWTTASPVMKTWNPSLNGGSGGWTFLK